MKPVEKSRSSVAPVEENLTPAGSETCTPWKLIVTEGGFAMMLDAHFLPVEIRQSRQPETLNCIRSGQQGGEEYRPGPPSVALLLVCALSGLTADFLGV